MNSNQITRLNIGTLDTDVAMPEYVKTQASKTTRLFVCIGDEVAKQVYGTQPQDFAGQLPSARAWNGSLFGWSTATERSVVITPLGSKVSSRDYLMDKRLIIPAHLLSAPTRHDQVYRIFLSYFIYENPQDGVTFADVVGWISAEEAATKTSSNSFKSFSSKLNVASVPLCELHPIDELPALRLDTPL